MAASRPRHTADKNPHRWPLPRPREGGITKRDASSERTLTISFPSTGGAAVSSRARARDP